MALSTAVPGFGQFYTGWFRSGLALLLLAIASWVAAADVAFVVHLVAATHAAWTARVERRLPVLADLGPPPAP